MATRRILFILRKRHKPEEIVAKLRQVDVLVSQGKSVADAVRAIGVATAVVWVRRALETGVRAAKPRGQPKGSKLDSHREAILGWIESKDDITIAEIRGRLVAERSVSAAVGTVWCFLDRCGLTFKKRPRTPPSRTGRTSKPSAKRGSTASSTSIRRA